MIPVSMQKKYCAGQKGSKNVAAVQSMISKAKRKKTFQDSEHKKIDNLKNPNTKMIIDFDCESSPSINFLAVNKTIEVKLTTLFLLV